MFDILDFENEIREINVKSRGDSLPGYEDLVGAMAALHRLHTVYNISIATIASGQIFDIKTDPLTHEDTFLIGNAAYERMDDWSAVVWLNYTMEAAIMAAAENNRTNKLLKRTARVLARSLDGVSI